MHIPDGLLNTSTLIATGVASSGTIATAVKKTKNHLEERHIPLMGLLAAFIFAAQMINFPVAIGASGHLIGAFLCAVIIGPWATILVMSSILIIQSIIFQDGGLFALGANIFNMAIIANFSGYYTYKLSKKISNKVINMPSIIAGGLVSVVTCAIAVAIEISLTGEVNLQVVMLPLVFWHVLIGLGEGLITFFVIKYISRVKRELLNF